MVTAARGGGDTEGMTAIACGGDTEVVTATGGGGVRAGAWCSIRRQR